MGPNPLPHPPRNSPDVGEDRDRQQRKTGREEQGGKKSREGSEGRQKRKTALHTPISLLRRVSGFLFSCNPQFFCNP